LRYHITTGIGIGTRIGIGARKKYRVSEVSVNPGIGLSLMPTDAVVRVRQFQDMIPVAVSQHVPAFLTELIN